MVRNPIVKEKLEEQAPQAPQETPEQEAAPVQVVEREINLSLINDKLNYLTGVIHKIAEAAEINIE